MTQGHWELVQAFRTNWNEKKLKCNKQISNKEVYSHKVGSQVTGVMSAWIVQFSQFNNSNNKRGDNDPQSQRDAHRPAPVAESAAVRRANEISICMFSYGHMQVTQRRGGGIPDPGPSLLSASPLQLWMKDTLKGSRRPLIFCLWLQNAIRRRPCLRAWLSHGLPQPHVTIWTGRQAQLCPN